VNDCCCAAIVGNEADSLVGEGCAALGRRLHREVNDGYAADREGGGLRLCCWVEQPLCC
jgi:hypothetical protein